MLFVSHQNNELFLSLVFDQSQWSSDKEGCGLHAAFIGLLQYTLQVKFLPTPSSLSFQMSHPSIHSYIHLSSHTSINPFICRAIDPCILPSFLSIYLSGCLIYQVIGPSIRLQSVCLSICWCVLEPTVSLAAQFLRFPSPLPSLSLHVYSTVYCILCIFHPLDCLKMVSKFYTIWETGLITSPMTSKM